ncbi:MAG: hypothetical protein WCK26_01760 [Candidatus Saccharibacteria bacterium]
MFKAYKGKLFCFSPPVMLATLIIEFGFAIYVLWRYKMTSISRLAIAILVSLGTFQAAEYMICGGLGWTHIEWARIGYVAITLLPALGIHMLVKLSGKKMPVLVSMAYASCIAFVTYYLVNAGAISGQVCYANYAVFYTNHASNQWFTAYYYGWLMIGTYLAWQWGIEQPKKRKTLHAMMMGYLVFLVPTTAFNIINPLTLKGIPSIMCGFAVLLAFVIVLKVLPNSCEVRASFQNIREKLQIRI